MPKAAPKKPMMKSYPSFAAYLKDQPAKNRALIQVVRRFVKKSRPELSEGIKWGNGVWMLDGLGAVFTYSGPDHVQLGFFYGSALKDPKGLLQGGGRYVRHLKLYKPSDFDAKAVAAFLKQALQLIKDGKDPRV